MARFRYYAMLLLPCCAAFLLSGTPAAATSYYWFDIEMPVTRTYEALDITVDYSSADGYVGGTGSGAWCTTNASLDALEAYNNVDPDLKVAFADTGGVDGPVVLASCVFVTESSMPTSGDFTVTVTNWESASTTTAPFIYVNNIR